MPNLCPDCRHVNAAATLQCAACGVDLRLARQRAAENTPLPASAASAGAIWLDDLDDLLSASPPKAPTPATPAAHAPRAPAPPAPFELTLRPVEVAGGAGAPRREKSPAPWPLIGDAIARAAPVPAPGPPSPSPASLKAAKRSAVRRERLRHAPPAASAAGGGASDVLVVDADPQARALLCQLLGAFGFDVHAVADAGVALDWARRRRVVAAFVDFPSDAGAAEATLALCKTIRILDRRDGAATVIAIVGAQLRPMDRVRAELAGCDEVIPKPVSRGSVARVLDERGVRLPSDARRR